MNYKGIVNWLQEDGFVLMAFNDKGEVSLMEKATGTEVNDLPSFLIATVLPIAKKKVISMCTYPVKFVEIHNTPTERPSETGALSYTQHNVESFIYSNDSVVSMGKGITGEYAMVDAIENFIKNKETMNDKG